jgi:hypothetical protein
MREAPRYRTEMKAVARQAYAQTSREMRRGRTEAVREAARARLEARRAAREAYRNNYRDRRWFY